jgi:transposase
MRTIGSAAELEARRHRAASLLAQGESCSKVSERLGVSLTSVKRWKAAWKKGGLQSLAAKPHPGPAPRLSDAQKRQLLKILARGPVASGFPGDLWTCARVAQVIRKRLQVTYHPGHVWYVLRGLNWSCQKPERRARERDEAAIARWRKRDWPRIKKERAAKS